MGLVWSGYMEGMWNGAGQRVRPSIFRVRFRALRAYVVPKIMWKTHDFSPPELFGGGLSTTVRPPFVYFVPLSRTKPAFWISTRTPPGPISQVLPGGRVRHPQYSKKLVVRFVSIDAGRTTKFAPVKSLKFS